MKKNPEITAQTRQNLMDAFWELYAQKRMETITVKEIAEKAGYNRGTFYVYFGSVYEVLGEIENTLIPTAEELPGIPAALGQAGLPLEYFMEFYEKNQKYYSVLLGENGDPAFAAKLKQAVKSVVAKLVYDTIDIDALELDYLLEYTLSGMVGIMSYWFSQGKNWDQKNLVDLVARLNQNAAIMRPPF